MECLIQESRDVNTGDVVLHYRRLGTWRAFGEDTRSNNLMSTCHIRTVVCVYKWVRVCVFLWVYVMCVFLRTRVFSRNILPGLTQLSSENKRTVIPPDPHKTCPWCHAPRLQSLSPHDDNRSNIVHRLVQTSLRGFLPVLSWEVKFIVNWWWQKNTTETTSVPKELRLG